MPAIESRHDREARQLLERSMRVRNAGGDVALEVLRRLERMERALHELAARTPDLATYSAAELAERIGVTKNRITRAMNVLGLGGRERVNAHEAARVRDAVLGVATFSAREGAGS